MPYEAKSDIARRVLALGSDDVPRLGAIALRALMLVRGLLPAPDDVFDSLLAAFEAWHVSHSPRDQLDISSWLQTWSMTLGDPAEAAMRDGGDSGNACAPDEREQAAWWDGLPMLCRAAITLATVPEVGKKNTTREYERELELPEGSLATAAETLAAGFDHLLDAGVPKKKLVASFRTSR